MRTGSSKGGWLGRPGCPSVQRRWQQVCGRARLFRRLSGTSDLLRQGRLCLRFRAAYAKKCGRKEQRVGGWGSRVGCSGESRRTGDSRFVPIPKRGVSSSIKCYEGGQLQRGRRGPALWHGGKRAPQAARGPTGGWKGADIGQGEASRPREVVEPSAGRARRRWRAKLSLQRRRWSDGRGELTVGGREVVRARWDASCQYRCLALHASGTGEPRGVITGANCVGGAGSFGRSRLRAVGVTDHMRCWHQSTVCLEVVVR